MKVFRVSGKFRMGEILAPFTLEAIGKDESNARDRVYSTIGSRHRANRHQIFIEKATEIKPDQVTDATVAKQLSMVK